MKDQSKLFIIIKYLFIFYDSESVCYGYLK